MSIKLLKKYNIKAKKSLWQNFLVDDEVLEEIADILEVNQKNIVEVWPGYWALTEKLIQRKPKELNLVELDDDMVWVLKSRIDNLDFDLEWIDFKLNHTDVLKYEWPPPSPLLTKEGGYSVIANIPYYITSPILRHFIYNVELNPENMVILMQKDVWDKILLALKNKKPKSSVLSLFIMKKYFVSEVLTAPKESFIPAPKVESSVLLFEKHDDYKDIDDEKFLELIKKWFKEPRKMLIKNLVNSWFEKEYIISIFEGLSIEKNTRPENLDIALWCELSREINN